MTPNKQRRVNAGLQKEELVVVVTGSYLPKCQAVTLIMASILKQLVVPRGKKTSATQGSSAPELDSESDPKPKLQTELEADRDSSTLPAQPQSPSPEAEYDKLLVRKKMITIFMCIDSAIIICAGVPKGARQQRCRDIPVPKQILNIQAVCHAWITMRPFSVLEYESVLRKNKPKKAL